jgi:hypothetical protein
VTPREFSPVVVYVDSDPVVLAHARALLAGNDSGLTIVDDDIRDPGRILGHPRTRRVAPGSFVILSHLTSEGHPADVAAKKEETWANPPRRWRTAAATRSCGSSTASTWSSPG